MLRRLTPINVSSNWNVTRRVYYGGLHVALKLLDTHDPYMQMLLVADCSDLLLEQTTSYLGTFTRMCTAGQTVAVMVLHRAVLHF
jgi:hypothetical protein